MTRRLSTLFMTTQGIATNKPAAVAFNARLRPILIDATAIVPDVPTVRNVSMIPCTVPSRPI